MKKSYRVKKEKEFQQVFNKKQSCANRRFVVYVLSLIHI
ncbi:ribonuclease P protein component, partial [Enterococcus sp. S157_ASV_20]|nr:ribonuclease P protein component [Enterococcus sp. S157_ASV_20]